MTSSTTPPRGSSRPAWLVPVVVVAIAGALIVAILSLGGGSDSDGTLTDGASGDDAVDQVTDRTDGSGDPAGDESGDAAGDGLALADVEGRVDDDPRALGQVDAPVVLVMFSDYQCPYCAKWNVDTLPVMMEHVDAGDLRIEFHDINVFGPESERSARAALAAGEQGAYLDYHSALFEGGQARSGGDLSDEALLELAGELGLDTDRFEADLSAPEIDADYDASQGLANRLGVMATPSFLMGGEPIRGAQPTEVFEQAFSDALARSG